MRSGLWDAAHAIHLDALEALRLTDHVYTTSFQILSACGLGDIELRRGNASTAAAHYRHAHRIIQESPRTLGGVRLHIRIDSGLAATYAMSGDLSRARELATAAVGQLETVAEQTTTATFECSLAQLWLILAATFVRLGELSTAATFLARARAKGWQDLPWLTIDPELGLLRETPEYNSFTDALMSAPAVEIVMPRFGAQSSANPV
jgi:predicted negative regulator of RcsB-dependent stress response